MLRLFARTTGIARGRGIYGVAPVLHLNAASALPVPLPASQTAGVKLSHILPAETRRYPDWDIQRIKDANEQLSAYIRNAIPELEKEVDNIAEARNLPTEVVTALKKFARGESLGIDDLQGDIATLLKEVGEEDAVIKQSFAVPEFDWDREYADAIDREVVEEKRLRWDNFAKIQLHALPGDKEALLPTLDSLVEVGVYMQKAAISFYHMASFLRKYKSGELSLTQFMDWWPMARDDAQASSWHGETLIGSGKSASRNSPDVARRAPLVVANDWTYKEFSAMQKSFATLEAPEVLAVPPVFYHTPSEVGKQPEVVAEDDEPWFTHLDVEKEYEAKKSGKKDDHH